MAATSSAVSMTTGALQAQASTALSNVTGLLGTLEPAAHSYESAIASSVSVLVAFRTSVRPTPPRRVLTPGRPATR